MASNVQILANEKETSNSTPVLRPMSRRTPSFLSLSPSNSWDSSYGSSSSCPYNEEYPTFISSTATTPLKFKGIPFSWEQLPGIPKHQYLGSKKKEYYERLLPLPPAGKSNSAAKKLLHKEEISPKKSNRDPFFAALVKCSKDDDDDDDHGTIWKGSSKLITRRRSLSDIFGFINLYTSCKRMITCAVSESTLYLRSKPSPHNYLLNRRST